MSEQSFIFEILAVNWMSLTMSCKNNILNVPLYTILYLNHN